MSIYFSSYFSSNFLAIGLELLILIISVFLAIEFCHLVLDVNSLVLHFGFDIFISIILLF